MHPHEDDAPKPACTGGDIAAGPGSSRDPAPPPSFDVGTSSHKAARAGGANQRHRFANHSIGSLPTAVDTRDNLHDDEIEAELAAREHCSAASSESGLSDSGSDDEAEADEGGSTQCHGGDAHSPGGSSTVAPPTGERDELPSTSDLNFDAASSGVVTQDFPRSTWSTAPASEAMDEDTTQGPPLLDFEGGLRSRGLPPRCPPRAWLQAVGFDVPLSEGHASGSNAAPAAPIGRVRYSDLFRRQLLARREPGFLSEDALARHDHATGPLPVRRRAGGAACPVGEEAGDWLADFLRRARAAPLCSLAGSALGEDLGEAVAAFLEGLSDSSAGAASLGGEEAQDGGRVTTQRVVPRPVARGRGRAGFRVESEAAVSTPGHSPRSEGGLPMVPGEGEAAGPWPRRSPPLILASHVGRSGERAAATFTVDSQLRV